MSALRAGDQRAAAGALAVALALLGAACQAGAPAERGAVPFHWSERGLRPGLRARGQAALAGEIAVLEGDDATVSGVMGSLGLRFDEERNDLAALTRRVSAELPDPPATLVLFTQFRDVGVAGPAYAVPIFYATPGTGKPARDERAEFGVLGFTGLVNLKRPLDHRPEALADTLVHELAHEHLAHLSARAEGSTVAVSLLGRQASHWTAGLASGGSLLGGHAWRETTPGRFLVEEAAPALSPLDLYGLGLLPAAEVPPFFLVRGLSTEGGAAIPPAATLFPGTRARGERVPLTIDDVVRALGERPPAEPVRRAVFALLLSPDQALTSTATPPLVDEIDRLRRGAELRYAELTGGRSTLETRWILEEEPPAAQGCGCAATTPAAAGPCELVFLLLLGRRAAAPRRTRWSCDRRRTPSASPLLARWPPDPTAT